MANGKLTFIGLGLHDEEGISLRGKKEIEKADKIYAEFYTSKLYTFDEEKLKETFGKPVIVLNRQQTEENKILMQQAKDHHVVFLTCGDPMVATTHVELRMQAIQNNIKTRIIHSASITSAAPGILGLQNYKFGRTTTLAYPEGDYFPTSPYDLINNNKKMGLHTLILLDIQADRNRYMTANEALKLLLLMEESRKEDLITEETIVCVVARAGSSDVIARADTIKNLLKEDFGPPLHTLVLPGNLNFMEIEALEVCCNLPSNIAQQLK